MRLPTPGLVLLLLFHILPFVGRPALIGGDEPHYALMAHSMAVDRDLALENNYEAVEQGSSAAGRKSAGTTLDRHLLKRGAETVFSHPLGLPLLAAPLLWLQNLVAPGAAPDIVLGLFSLSVTFAALLEGLRLLAKFTRDPRVGWVIGLVIYFTTPLWFYSRTFFTEPFVWSGLVLALGWLDRDRPFATSLMLGLTFLIKETAVLAIVPILLWAWWRRGFGSFLRLSALPVVALLLFGLKNLWVYGEWWVTFQPYQIGSPWWAGLVGLFLDLQHGLLPFAPVALLAIVGWIGPRLSTSRSGLLAGRLAFAAFAGYFIVSGLWVDWRGGSGYGPRLLVPVLPALAVPMVYLVRAKGRYGFERRVAPALVVLGFAIQWSAVTNPFGAFWSISLPQLVLTRPLPFLSGLVLGTLVLWRLFPWEFKDAGRDTLS